MLFSEKVVSLSCRSKIGCGSEEKTNKLVFVLLSPFTIFVPVFFEGSKTLSFSPNN